MMSLPLPLPPTAPLPFGSLLKSLPPLSVPSFAPSSHGALYGLSLILCGCCFNVFTLEVLTSNDAGVGTLVTFCQFLFISLEGLFSHSSMEHSRLVLQPRRVPLIIYAKITSIFFFTSLLNNKALDFHISVPVHTVFRSSGLAATLLVGRWGYRLRYSTRQLVACAFVTLGILAVTLADATGRNRACCDDVPITSTLSVKESVMKLMPNTAGFSTDWCIGIFMLFTALFLSAYLGHEQDKSYRTYGKETWKEVMFYSHLFALPGFIFAYQDMAYHGHVLLTSPPARLPIYGWSAALPVPLWMILLLNLVLQAVCIRGVYLLTMHTNILTCNLAITARKLLSLILSVVCFGNVFTAFHWIGASLVFAGVLVYSHNPHDLMKSPITSPTNSEASQLILKRETVVHHEKANMQDITETLVDDHSVSNVVGASKTSTILRQRKTKTTS